MPDGPYAPWDRRRREQRREDRSWRLLWFVFGCVSLAALIAEFQCL